MDFALTTYDDIKNKTPIYLWLERIMNKSKMFYYNLSSSWTRKDQETNHLINELIIEVENIKSRLEDLDV